MASRLWPVLVATLAALTATRPSPADEPTAATKETARALMDAGHASDEQGDHRAALERFRAADALMHVPTTGLEMAKQQVLLGLLVEARDTALRVIRLPPGSREPAPFVRARERAQAMADDLARRIPSLKISIANGAEFPRAQVSVDSVTIPVAVLGAPYKVNPGHHVVSAADGSARGELAVDVAEGSVTPVDLTLTGGAIADADQAAEGQGKPDLATDDRPASTPSSWGWLRWSGLGLAIAGVGTGTVAGVMSLSATKSAKAACPGGQCPPSAWGDLHTAQTTATISDIGFVVAGVGAAAFVTSFLLGGSGGPSKDPDPPAPTAIRVEPWVGLPGAGIVGVF
jgi:hypothetical protein